MNAASNKKLMHDIFAELAQGNREPFRNALAEDFSWTIMGRTPWSRTYRGRDEVREKLFGPLFAQFADEYRNTAIRFIAEDEYVVVECRGRVTTKSGKPYNNEYCYIVRLEGGKLRELTEYMDTELVNSTLSPPAS